MLLADDFGIAEAAQIVKEGGLVAYPTDTLYGLGCDPMNEDAVRRLISAKGKRMKPLPVLVKDIEETRRIAIVTDRAVRLAERFWPGPLTIVLQKRDCLPGIVTSGSVKVGVRKPNHEVAMRLITLAGGFLIGTSANLSGAKPCTDASEVARQIGERVDLILDGGLVPLGLGSTVVELVGNDVRILRTGPISEDDLKAAFRR